MKKGSDNETDRHGTVSRRRFIQGVIATSATAGIVGLPTVTGATAAPTRVLTTAQGRALTRVVNQLIPAEGAMPGAGTLGVVEYIDKALAVAPHLRRHILTVLTALPDSATLEQLSAADLDRQLRHIEQEQNESFDILLQATYSGYYTHPRVVAALGWTDFEQLPDHWEPFDVRLLDNVRNRGSIYKDV